MKDKNQRSIPVTEHTRRVRVGSRDNWRYETRVIGATQRVPAAPFTPQPSPQRNNVNTSEQRPYPDINQVALVGRITDGPNLKHVGEKQTPVAELAVRVNNPQGEPSDIDVQIWAGGANAVHRYTKSGDQIVVTGRLRSDSYNNQTRLYVDAGTNGIQFTGDF